MSTALLATAVLVCVPGVAAAQSQLGARAELGFAGEVSINDGSSDLEASFGLEALFSHRIHEHVSLGGGVGFTSWKAEEADEDTDRNLLVDLSFRPSLHALLTELALLRASAILGPTYSSLGESEFPFGEIENAIGYHIGLGLGADIYLAEDAGLAVELSFQAHEAEHEIDTIVGADSVDGSVTQFYLQIGGFFSL